MLNDKIIGVVCLVLIVLALCVLNLYGKVPLDPGVKEIASNVVSGILGAMVGLPIGVRMGQQQPK